MIRLSHAVILVFTSVLLHTMFNFGFNTSFNFGRTKDPIQPSSVNKLTILVGRGLIETSSSSATDILKSNIRNGFASLEAALTTREEDELEKDPHGIVKNTRKIVYDMRETRLENTGEDSLGTRSVVLVDEVLKDLTLLSRFSNLTSFTVYFPTTKQKVVRKPESSGSTLQDDDEAIKFPPFNDADIHLQTEVLKLCANTFTRNTQFQLDALEVHGLLPRSNGALTSVDLKAVFGTLKHLAISVYPGRHVHTPQNMGFNAEEAKFLRALTDLMKSSSASLESLTYRGDMDEDYVDERWRLWEGLSFPRLKKLQFEWAVFDAPGRSTRDSVAFILRHKDTLTSLRMENCFVNNLAVGSWRRVFGSLRKAILESSHSERKADGSFGLTEFIFVPQPGTREEDGMYPEKYDGYGWFLDGQGLVIADYDAIIFEIGDEDEEVRMMKALKKVVDERGYI